MSDLSVMYSSKSDEWATPQSFFDEINMEFDFNLDPCSTEENHKCEEYYTQEENGLSKNWGGEGYSATHLIAILRNGLQRLFMKQRMMIP